MLSCFLQSESVQSIQPSTCSLTHSTPSPFSLSHTHSIIHVCTIAQERVSPCSLETSGLSAYHCWLTQLSFFLSLSLYSSTFKLTYCPSFERQASSKHLFHSEHHRWGKSIFLLSLRKHTPWRDQQEGGFSPYDHFLCLNAKTSNLALPGLHVQTPDTSRSSAGQVGGEVEWIDALVKDCR